MPFLRKTDFEQIFAPMMIVANRLIKTLKEKELTLALAESITCGLATQKLSNFKGTAEVLKGSVICYTPEVKSGVLGISERTINKYSCESPQVTSALAQHLHSLINADICAALTGLASSGGSETKNKPVGTVFFAVFYKKKTHRLRKIFRGTPLQIREKACEELYRFILKLTE